MMTVPGHVVGFFLDLDDGLWHPWSASTASSSHCNTVNLSKSLQSMQ